MSQEDIDAIMEGIREAHRWRSESGGEHSAVAKMIYRKRIGMNIGCRLQVSRYIDIFILRKTGRHAIIKALQRRAPMTAQEIKSLAEKKAEPRTGTKASIEAAREKKKQRKVLNAVGYVAGSITLFTVACATQIGRASCRERVFITV